MVAVPPLAGFGQGAGGIFVPSGAFALTGALTGALWIELAQTLEHVR
jgi:hypothetical protein